ncbi:hypothetical protein [Flavobacterium luteum]|uniref:hypothetical protein n=1 Tax=Flavobacterium luteum TaxID=2026654 RepID=UPI00177C2A98|nr:hypothetical protein [Flavobacterium luteum]
MLEARLICHFLGNITKWLFYFGTKSMDEVVKDDNSSLGFIILLVLTFLLFSFNK